VIGAILPEVVKEVCIIRVPKVCSPCMPYRELVESQHVRHWHLHIRLMLIEQLVTCVAAGLTLVLEGALKAAAPKQPSAFPCWHACKKTETPLWL
jgi:hypothetical protein